jgi:hypothetical protein
MIAPPLAPWPEKPFWDTDDTDWMRYERARADAWEARCRMAVEKLKEAREDIDNWAGYASTYFVEKHDLAGCLRGYEEALALIGELPPAGATP